MIPASYLFKDAFRHTWARDDGQMGEAPVRQEQPANWPAPSALQSARDLFDLAFGPRRGRK